MSFNLNPASVRALDWSAAILLLIGAMVMSPAAAFLLVALATLAAGVSAVFGRGRPRLVGAVLLIFALGATISLYSRLVEDQAAYRARR